MLFENTAVVVFFFVPGRVYRETFGGVCHVGVRHLLFGQLFQGVYPVVSHSVRELFFLPPNDAFGQEIFEGFPQYPFFNPAVFYHFIFGVQAHGHVEKFFIEERHTPFHSPRTERFVGA